MSTLQPQFKAFVQSGVCGALVWDAEVVKRLRVEWRVVGGLVGALPWQPRQNTELGLPLLLAPEEIALLRKKGVLDLRRYATPTPSSDDVITFTRLRERNEQQQLEVYGEDTSSFSPLTHTLTSDPRLHSDHTLFPAATHTPSTAQEQQTAVYLDLWERGFTLTSGLKYGADYLVYRGDPALVHSSYLALVVPWQQPIKTLQSLCRVGSKVAKAVLLCSVKEGKVQYQTVEWTGDNSRQKSYIAPHPMK